MIQKYDHKYNLSTRCHNVSMIERERTDVSDSIRWYCPQCYTRKSIRQNSFFAKSRLPLQKWILLMYLWVRQYPVTDAYEEAEHTTIDIYQWLHEVCSQTLLSDPPIILGGPQIIVQIDVSLFRHKPKVRKFSENGIHILYSHTNSITGAEQLLRMCGYLGWLIPPSLLHWATWKLFPDGTQRHCYLSSMPTQHQERLSIQMNG